MKNILLLVHDDDGQEARLQAALDVTRALEGHLICLDVVVPPPVYPDVYGSGADAMLIQDERQREAANRQQLEGRLAREDVSWSWQEATGDLVHEVTRASGLADLIVLNSHFEAIGYPDRRRVAADIAIKSGRPILAVCDKCKGFAVTGKAMIAWDGSGPAANALKAALPLLKLASDVTLFEVGEPDRDYPATEAATWLSRHEIHAKVLGRDPGGTIAETVLDRAHHSDAAYIVMGVFGHSRAAEALLGGVSRSMLAKSDVPLLLAH